MSHTIMMSPEIDKLIEQALREDISAEDITTNAIINGGEKGEVQLIAKEDSVLAGLSIFYRVFHYLDPGMEIETKAKDGDYLRKGEVVAVLRGDLRALLSGERTALNFLQRMSGIATLTYQWTQELEGTKTRLLDTRKTTPNMRIFEKYAVKVGGGGNHRYNLSDGVLIKDNHIHAAGSVGEAIRKVRRETSFVRRIEVEVETLNMVQEALDERADIIMLDNMGTEEMKRAIKMIDGRAITECSGNITKGRLKELAAIGVDFISCGALTHSSGIRDFSLKNLKVIESE